MTTTTTTTERIAEVIREELIDAQVIELAAEIDNYMGLLDDDRAWPMDELDVMCSHMSPTEIIQSASDFNLNADYFCFSIYGLVSYEESEYANKLRSDWADAMAEEIAENASRFFLPEEIEEVFEEEE